MQRSGLEFVVGHCEEVPGTITLPFCKRTNHPAHFSSQSVYALDDNRYTDDTDLL